MSQPTFNLPTEIHRQSWLRLRRDIDDWLCQFDEKITELEAIPADELTDWQFSELQKLITLGQIFTSVYLLVDELFTSFAAESAKWNVLLMNSSAPKEELEFLRSIYTELMSKQQVDNQVIERLAETILNNRKQ